jgi:hypothetical protein
MSDLSLLEEEAGIVQWLKYVIEGANIAGFNIVDANEIIVG